jgi:cold shock protein
MPAGTVKWFNVLKGYGFIRAEGGGGDVFVHVSAVQAAGLKGLEAGQRVAFEVVERRGRPAAGGLKPAAGAAPAAPPVLPDPWRAPDRARTGLRPGRAPSRRPSPAPPRSPPPSSGG